MHSGPFLPYNRNSLIHHPKFVNYVLMKLPNGPLILEMLPKLDVINMYKCFLFQYHIWPRNFRANHVAMVVGEVGHGKLCSGRGSDGG